MKKIILAGKGGSGKTTITSLLLTRILSTQETPKILVIDADPAANLLISFGYDKPVEIDAIGELAKFIPERWEDYSENFFQFFLSKHIARIEHRSGSFDYGFLGHHTSNSCLCAYNNSLNYLLKHLARLNKYDYVFLDREAGVEHINRSVYGGDNDRLIVASWPTPEYLSVARDIFSLADILGTTSHRLLIINNSPGLEFSENELLDTLVNFEIDSVERLLLNKIQISDGLRKLSASEVLNRMSEEQVSVLDSAISFVMR